MSPTLTLPVNASVHLNAAIGMYLLKCGKEIVIGEGYGRYIAKMVLAPRVMAGTWFEYHVTRENDSKVFRFTEQGIAEIIRGERQPEEGDL